MKMLDVIFGDAKIAKRYRNGREESNDKSLDKKLIMIDMK